MCAYVEICIHIYIYIRICNTILFQQDPKVPKDPKSLTLPRYMAQGFRSDAHDAIYVFLCGSSVSFALDAHR